MKIYNGEIPLSIEIWPDEFPKLTPNEEYGRHPKYNAPFPGDATLVEDASVEPRDVDCYKRRHVDESMLVKSDPMTHV